LTIQHLKSEQPANKHVPVAAGCPARTSRLLRSRPSAGSPSAPRVTPAGPDRGAGLRLTWIASQTEALVFRSASSSSRCGAAVCYPFISSLNS